MKKKFNLEKYSYYFLNFWLFLPIVMFLYQIFNVFNGYYITKEQIIAAGYEEGKIYYTSTLNGFISFFTIFGLISIAVSIYILIKNRKRIFNRENKLFYILLILLIWSFICMLKADDPLLAFNGDLYLYNGCFSFLVYAAIFILASSVKSQQYRMNLVKRFVYIISFLAFVIIVQEFHVIEFLDILFPTYRATVFSHYNHFGYMLCMAAAASFTLLLKDENNKKLYLCPTAVLYVALTINNTFGSYLALIVTVPFIYFLNNNFNFKDKNIKKYAFIFIVIILLSFLVFEDLRSKLFRLNSDIINISVNNKEALDAGAGRMLLWEETVSRIVERPLFGFGPVGLSGLNSLTMNDSPHNEFLQIAAELGITGLILYLSFFVLFFKSAISKLNKLSVSFFTCFGMIVTYLISSFFGNPVFNVYLYFWLFIGLAL